MESLPSGQRSFRLSRSTSELLDAKASQSTESRNSIADRVLGEGLRTERHPSIRFRTGAAGRREPALVGTRLLVRQVVATVKSAGNNVAEAGEVLSLPAPVVQAALSYYVDYSDEVDDDQRWADDMEDIEHRRWERERALLT